mmetsp:Transcript_19533/g.58576  ORF Transcript_19533/g.58576 Transcript_19533/m.58576 type:complete len:456 (+) Transcript_19533:889-2256(+)
MGPGELRRRPHLRVRGPAPRRARGVGHEGLQLQEVRGARLPPGRAALLDRAVPHRWHPSGRGVGDALPELHAQGRRLDPERERRRLQPGGRVPAPGAEPPGEEAPPGHHHVRGGVDVLERRDPEPRGALGPRLRLQVGPGLDERHPQLPRGPLGREARQARQAHLPRAVHAAREVDPAPLPRRGGERKGLPGRQDELPGLPALLRQAEAAPNSHRLPGGLAGAAASLHGRRDRPGQGVELQAIRRLARGRGGGAGQVLHLGVRPHGRVPEPQALPRRGRRAPRRRGGGHRQDLRVDGGGEQGRLPRGLHAALGKGAASALRLQLQQQAVQQLRHGRACRWHVEGDAELRRLAVRRHWLRAREQHREGGEHRRALGLAGLPLARHPGAELHGFSGPRGLQDLWGPPGRRAEGRGEGREGCGGPGEARCLEDNFVVRAAEVGRPPERVSEPIDAFNK